MPGKESLRHSLGIEILTDIFLQYFVAHLKHSRARCPRIEVLLFQVVAILASEVAGRAGRLGHHVKRTRER